MLSVMSGDLTAVVRSAHGDAWQELGLMRQQTGGQVALLPGGRLMSSGLPLPQYNNVDVTDVEALDLNVVRAWYAKQDVPWGVRVPIEMSWSAGRHLFRKRLMSRRGGPLAVPAVDGLELRAATRSELDAVVAVDCSAFGGEPEESRAWIEPMTRSGRVRMAVGVLAERIVASAYTVRSDGWAGPAAYLAGVAVHPSARRRGVGRAISAWLTQDAIRGGAQLVHCHPDSSEAARIYATLGFVETPGFDIFVDL